MSPPSGRFTPHGTHEVSFRVYYEDTDAAGIVYYANYLKFAERARTEALRLAGIEQAEMLAAGQGGFVVRRATVEYHASAALDDLVTVETSLLSLAKVRLSMRQHLRRKKVELATLTVDIVMVDGRRKPVRIPPVVAAALRGFLLKTAGE